MLVLTRKARQSLIFNFGDAQVRVKIVYVGKDKVRVGIEAPPAVKILRAELEDDRSAA